MDLRPCLSGRCPRDLICALRDQAEAIFSNILCSLISGMACILVCYLGIGQHVEMIMIGNIMLLIPGVLMTNSFRDFISGDMISGLLHFSEAMITAVCVAAGFILSKILLGGML